MGVGESCSCRLVTDKGEMRNISVKFIGAVKLLLIIFWASPQMESGCINTEVRLDVTKKVTAQACHFLERNGVEAAHVKQTRLLCALASFSQSIWHL